MGEPVAVLEKKSSKKGFIRFETNRSFTGMGHEHYESSEPFSGDRPVDNLARTLIHTGQVEQVHIYAQMLTVKLADGKSSSGIKKLVEDFFLFYGKSK